MIPPGQTCNGNDNDGFQKHVMIMIHNYNVQYISLHCHYAKAQLGASLHITSLIVAPLLLNLLNISMTNAEADNISLALLLLKYIYYKLIKLFL